MHEMGYDYLKECEKTCKVLHFSSFRDKGKPWDPICIMPGFLYWWEYAQRSPYYREYFTEQWNAYDRRDEKVKQLEKNITYRNVLAMILLVYIFIMLFAAVVWKQELTWYMVTVGGFLLAACITLLVRKVSMYRKK